VISALLDSPEAKRIKDAGSMVGDREVIDLLFRQLLEPRYRDGVILDGFPRTKVQVECLKLLVDKMHALRRDFYRTPLGIHFRQPTIHIMVLFVDEATSVARQLKRGLEVRAHNKEVRGPASASCSGGALDGFRQGPRAAPLPGLQGADLGRPPGAEGDLPLPLRQRPGALPEVEKNIMRELEYQSTLELDPRTVDRLRGIRWRARSSSTPGRSS
jgi:adenylate kinase